MHPEVPSASPRTRAQRRRDTVSRLETDIDAWIATASDAGSPSLVPLSFDWDGDALLFATRADSPTGRNLSATGIARIALGPTRDVTMIDGRVEAVPLDHLPDEAADRFAARTGFDPRAESTPSTPYRWFRVHPQRIQAWREVDELPGRDLMRDGEWLA